jgi:predicted acyltransferase
MFMVGVSLPYSIASRRAKGQSFGRMLLHSAIRAFVLIALGIFLRSQSRSQTYFTFEDVLTQIGLGYVFLFLLGWAKPRLQLLAAGVILVVYWAAFALYPLPPAGFDTTTVGVRADWPHHVTGFAAHWDKNTNLAARVDQWFLNLFPRERPFVYNGGGYLTLNFVPSLATMIFGLLAGGVLRSARTDRDKIRTLVLWGVAGIVSGLVVHLLGLCPIVKRIWTPSWTLFSSGWVILFLAGYYYVIDVKGFRKWTYPFLVVGANSIAMYVLVHVATDYMNRAWLIHLGRGPFEMFGPVFVPVLLGACTLGVFWLMLAWMYRHRVYIRI